jgi:hypothetical protein
MRKCRGGDIELVEVVSGLEEAMRVHVEAARVLAERP